MFVEFILFGVTLLLLLWLMIRKPEKFPPGPPIWPIVGNSLQVKRWGSWTYLGMAEAARRYGNIVGLYIGRNPVILISGLDLIKEVSYRDDLSGRQFNIMNKELDKGMYGVINVSGEKWKEQRRFTLRHLRDLGFGKRSLEGIAHEELQAVFEKVEELSGGQKSGWAKPVPAYDILGTAGINVLWHIVAGKRYSHSDPYLNELIDHVKILTTLVNPGGDAALSFPNLYKLFPVMSGFTEIAKIRRTLHKFMKAKINKHRETLDSENPRDFMDVYITEIDKQKNNPATFFDDRQLIKICVDLFVAGSGTTFNSLTFVLLYMVLYPKVQQKVQDEIDRVVGRDRLPSLDDRSSMHYVEATLHEALRISSVSPLAVPHTPLYAEKDFDFKGYLIPKDSRLILNLHALHHDPKIWGDPENFRPERFLDENGKFFRHEALLPFGTGKRVCLGEPLARNNLFIFVTGLMQRYSMEIPNGYPKPSEEKYGGVTLAPMPFQVKVQQRQ